MARADRIKEEIGWLKLVFGILVAIDAPLTGWLAQNYATGRRALVIAGLVATAIITFIVAVVNAIAYHRIKQLEDA